MSIEPRTNVRGGYLLKRLADAPTVPCPCGLSTRILTREDGPTANFHITEIHEAAAHYHERCTEIYYILEGQGRIELNGEAVDVEPGTLVVIEPYTVHRLSSAQGVRTLVIGVPALDLADEVLVDEG